MKLPMILIASATALSLSFGLAPAHAEDAFVSIEQ
jgi:minor curlin subunit